MASEASEISVKVHVLPTGYLWLPDRWIFSDGDVELKHLAPDYSFLIRHPSGRNVLFDLGLRKDHEKNPQVILDDYAAIDPYVPKDAYDLLLEGPVHPNEIDTVILSHMHFDHTGDVSRFPDARIVLGPGSRKFTSPGYPDLQKSPFDGSVLKHPRFSEFLLTEYTSLPEGSVPIDFPFTSGVDIFGDNSLFILDAPGHMPGHQMAIARTGPNEWMAMGGDCCHHRAFLDDPSRQISTDVGPNGQPGFHKYPCEAVKTIQKLQKLHMSPDVLVVLAHDANLDGRIPIYPQNLNGWKMNKIKGGVRHSTLTLEEVQARYN